MPAGTDKYVNVLLDSVVMSAANTLTYNEINIGLSTFDRVGLLIHQIQYFPAAATIGDLVTSGDFYQLALVGSNSPTDIGSDERSVFDKVEEFLNGVGTPATIALRPFPRTSDLSNLPMGGLLVPPRPLYFAANTSGAGAAGTFYIRIYFTTVQLKDTDYFELLETFRFFE